MDNIENKYRTFPFWSWNDKLDKNQLVKQIDWMHESGIGGFFMHARGGLTTEYLGAEWFECIEACLKRAKELDMEGYAYDENGWPSGFVGGKLLEEEENHDMFLTYSIGEYDEKANVSYDISTDKLVKTNQGNNVLNVFIHNSACTADICNKKVVDKFIALTHEQYKKHDKYGNLRGFFTDEPQYYRWATAYTRVLPEYFKTTYGEDIFDRLGLLFVEKEGFRDFRYKYWKAMQSLMLKNFAENIYLWCDNNGYKLTGHYCEENTLEGQMWCAAGLMPFYEFEHIPGIDFLGRNLRRCASSRQLGSVASQLGKEQRMAEIFACSGWDATPNELRLLAEYVMVGGVNILCPHLLPYTEHGQRKRDYPEHFSAINPWVSKDFKTFNDYFAERGKLLAKSKEIANVAVLHPMRSAYFDYKFGQPNRGLEKIDKSFVEDNLMFEKNHLPFHYLDEVILSKYGSVNGSKLICGLCSYDYLIIPQNVVTMDESTEKLLKKYVENGGKVLLLGEKPNYIGGNEYNYDYLTSNTTLDEIISSQDVMMEKSDDVVCSYHSDENGNIFVYALNTGDETDVIVSRKGFKNVIVDGKVLSNKVHFDKFESKIIYFTNDELDEVKETKLITLGNKFKVEKTDKNYIALDLLTYSTDGKNYGKKLHYMAIFENLLKERYSGDVYLKYDVEIKKIPSICFALIENTRTKNVHINGKLVNKCGSVLEPELWKYDIAKMLKEGHNEIVVQIDFFESEEVYYALYGENVTESLKNCLAYDTSIEPIYLQGDFGVFGEFTEKGNCYFANSFYLDEQKEVVTNLVTEGFPFFRGEIKLSQEIDIKDFNTTLLFDKRFQMIDLFVNDKFVDKLMFKTKADISNYVKVGKNKIEIELTVSNRNLLGLHHSHEDEPFSIGPFNFERFGTWDEDGNSPIYKARYSFVKVI